MRGFPHLKALQDRAAERELAERRETLHRAMEREEREHKALRAREREQRRADDQRAQRQARAKARRAELQALETKPYLLAIADDPEDWWTDFTEIRLNLTDDEARALTRLVDEDSPHIFRPLDK